jgi:hypothetical protein
MNPSALKEAAALDKERKSGGARGLLHGIPVSLMGSSHAGITQQPILDSAQRQHRYCCFRG